MKKYHQESLEASRISTFLIGEGETVESYRYKRAIHVKTLTAAKVNATKAQEHAGTVLQIEDIDGFLLAYKDAEGKWHG